MSRTETFGLAAALFFLLCGVGTAADKVVVIPLGGATGDAVAGDVVTGKTFSNAEQKGISGTRPLVPIAKTGATTSYHTGDDASYASRLGEATADRFETSVTGVHDGLTGLEWEESPPNITSNWTGAIVRCEALFTGIWPDLYGDWRLPNINELLSIIDRDYQDPALAPRHYLSLPSTTRRYWTSTPASTGVEAWQISFDLGDTARRFFSDTTAYSICVRGQLKTP